MKKYDYDLIVIGGGAAGLTAATGAGQLGAKVLLVERKAALGGDCLHYGCVPSKTLIKTAYCYNVMREAEQYGLPRIDVPAVDFARVRQRIQSVIETIARHDSPEWLRDKYNVETLFGRACFTDPHTITVDGRRITARNFIIATGTSPLIPAVAGLKDTPFVTNLEIFSLSRLPRSMLILGGGPIGMEMAQAFARLGTRVQVVQSQPQILPKEDRDVAEYLQALLEEDDLDIQLNTRAVAARQENGEAVLTVRRDGEELDLRAEVLLVAAGRRANVNDLGLDQAGVSFTPKGITVDARLRTTARHIYACGDVNGGFQFTHVAGYEGGIAMVNAILRLPVKADYTRVPWCTYLDPELASVGYNEQRARQAGIAYSVQVEDFKDNDRALADGERGGFLKILINKKGAPIGVQILGHHAGDLIHEWVAVINGRVPLATIAQSMHAYPTLSEINKQASGDYLAPRLFNDSVRRLLKACFGLQGKY